MGANGAAGKAQEQDVDYPAGTEVRPAGQVTRMRLEPELLRLERRRGVLAAWLEGLRKEYSPFYAFQEELRGALASISS